MDKKIEEIYIDIPTFDGLYKLSNLDNVKSFKTKNFKILKGYVTKKGYLNYSLYKDNKMKTIPLHVLKMMVYKGFVPNKQVLVIDHKDNNPLNNDLDNLQVITNRENCSKEKKGKSKYVGVSPKKNKWRVDISINGKPNYLGCYNTQFEAHLVYQKALNKIKEVSND